MATYSTWRCPGCGSLVVLPMGERAADDVLDERRLDQLAQALCACWVKGLSEQGVSRLVEAIVSVDDDAGPLRVIAGGKR